MLYHRHCNICEIKAEKEEKKITLKQKQTKSQRSCELKGRGGKKSKFNEKAMKIFTESK